MNPFLRSSAFAAAAITLCGWAGTSAGSSLPGWYTDFDEAVAAAQREGKPLLADIGSENCPACRMLESQTLSHPAVKQRLDNFVKVQIDGNMSPHLLQKFGVEGYPTVVALDTRGGVVGRSVGFVKAGEFAGTLDSALARSGPPPQRQGQPKERPEGAEEAPGSERGDEAEVRVAAKSGDREKSERSSRRTPEEAVAVSEESREVARNAAPSRKIDTSSFSFYQSDAQRKAAPAMEESAAKAVPETTTLKPRIKLVAQAASTRFSDAAQVRNVPAPPSDMPQRLLNLNSSNASGAGDRPSASDEGKSAGKSSASAKSSGSSSASSLATIKKLQGAGKTGSQTAQEESGEKSVSSAVSAPRASKSTVNDSGDDASEKKTDADEEKAESEEKEAVSAADVRRWMEDADGHLKAQRKKEARAMYAKVVDADPENRFGRSDLAFIQRAMLMVDVDDDALRKQALAEIRKFKKRFPNSTRKDHYAVMHAILAADVGETDEAHGLLDTFRQDYPNSRFKDLAYQTWEQLPPVKSKSKSGSSSESRASSSKSSSRSTASSGASRR